MQPSSLACPRSCSLWCLSVGALLAREQRGTRSGMVGARGRRRVAAALRDGLDLEAVEQRGALRAGGDGEVAEAERRGRRDLQPRGRRRRAAARSSRAPGRRSRSPTSATCRSRTRCRRRSARRRPSCRARRQPGSHRSGARSPARAVPRGTDARPGLVAFSPPVRTDTLRNPIAAPGSIVMFAIADVGEVTVRWFTVTPSAAPCEVRDAGDARGGEVRTRRRRSSTSSVEPTAPVLGVTDRTRRPGGRRRRPRRHRGRSRSRSSRRRAAC